MLIFSVDTSGRNGSIALCRGTANSWEVLEIVPLAGRSYSAKLIPELSSILARYRLQKHDLEAFAVVSGPGSFTGLRVGLSTIKGLAEILHCPVATVSMLEAVAAQAKTGGRVIAALDAGRKEVYAGEYDLSSGEPEMLRELLLSETEFVALLTANAEAELVTPDAVIGALVPQHRSVQQIEWPDAVKVARLGFKKICKGVIVPPETLEANYIRRSDAEIFSNARSHG